MRNSQKVIGLLDHMGFGNLGDAAIHESFMENIQRRLPEARLIAFSQNPDDTTKRHGIEAHPIRRPANISGFTLGARFHVIANLAERLRNTTRELAHLLRSYRVVRSLDLLIVSGGGQLCDLWWDQPYNIFKFCLLARLSNTPVFIVGVGADRLEGISSKLFARWAVRLANYTSFRDRESQALIRSLGVKSATHVCPDPAYALHFREHEIGPSNTVRTKVGLNPMGFCDPRMWPRKDVAAYNSYLDKLTRFSAWLLSQNYDLEFFTSDAGVDKYAMEDLRERLLAACPADVSKRIVCCSAASLDELLSQMSTFDYIVTSKFHGVIFSHLLVRPVIALSYMAKIDHLMRAVGHEQYCLDIEHFDVNALREAFDSLVQNADGLKCLFRKTTAIYQERLRAEFDSLSLKLMNRDLVTAVSGWEGRSAE